VLGHHHVSDHHKAVTLAHLFQHSQKQIAALRAGQPGLPMIATAVDEMKVARSVVARRMAGHRRTLTRLEQAKDVTAEHLFASARRRNPNRASTLDPTFAKNAKVGHPSDRAGEGRCSSSGGWPRLLFFANLGRDERRPRAFSDASFLSPLCSLLPLRRVPSGTHRHDENVSTSMLLSGWDLGLAEDRVSLFLQNWRSRLNIFPAAGRLGAWTVGAGQACSKIPRD
jgi:hypothetical protein